MATLSPSGSMSSLIASGPTQVSMASEIDDSRSAFGDYALDSIFLDRGADKREAVFRVHPTPHYPLPAARVTAPFTSTPEIDFPHVPHALRVRLASVGLFEERSGVAASSSPVAVSRC